MRITAAIVARDEAEVIGRALASIAEQSRLPDEVLVVDDGSTDGTAEIADRAGARVVRCGQGEPEARNLALAEATGTHLAFLDADDAWPPDHLAQVAALLDRDPAPDLVVAGSVEHNEAGDFVRRRTAMEATTADELYLDGGFRPSQAVVSVAAARSIGGFDVAQRRSCDLDFALRLLASGVTIARAASEVRYQVRDREESADKLRELEAVRERLHAKAVGTVVSPSVAVRARRRHDVDLAKRYLKSGSRRHAARLAVRALPRRDAVVVLGLALLPRRVRGALVNGVRRLRARDQAGPAA